MKIVYWIGGIVVASVIGWLVWKLLDNKVKNLQAQRDSAKGTQSFTEASATPALDAKILSFLPSVKKTQLSTGLGPKKGFIA